MGDAFVAQSHEQGTSLNQSLLKLLAKKQTTAQQQLTTHAVSLYYELLQP
jgi:hypothetical protein